MWRCDVLGLKTGEMSSTFQRVFLQEVAGASQVKDPSVVLALKSFSLFLSCDKQTAAVFTIATKRWRQGRVTELAIAARWRLALERHSEGQRDTEIVANLVAAAAFPLPSRFVSAND